MCCWININAEENYNKFKFQLLQIKIGTINLFIHDLSIIYISHLLCLYLLIYKLAVIKYHFVLFTNSKIYIITWNYNSFM